MTRSRANSGIAFLLGVGASLLPSYGPFAAFLFVLTVRLRLKRSDLPWFAAALLSAISVAVHGGVGGALFGLLQVLGPWAIYRAFSELHAPFFEQLPRHRILQGLFVGFALLVALGFGRVRFNLAYPTFTQAIAWGGNPALFAHMVLVVGSLIALLARRGWLRFATLALVAIGTLAAGSREASAALVVVVGYFLATTLVERKVGTAIALFAVAAGLVTALTLGPALGLGKIGYLVQPVPASASPNLIRGSELPKGDWWDEREVSVTTEHIILNGASLVRYIVTKRGNPGWLRLQQVVPIESSQLYTVSAWIRDAGPQQRPGIQGWGRARDGGVVALTAQLNGGSVEASVRGPAVLRDYGIASTEGAWRRVFATFALTGPPSTLDWYVGLAPNNSTTGRSTASFAGFQLEKGSLTAYQPGAATRGLGLASGRLGMWHVAWQGALQRPWFGWGSKTFPGYYVRSTSRAANADIEVPAHAHDLYLEVLFERGVFGLIGLLALLAGLAWGPLQHRDVGYLWILVAVLLANVFDYTLFFGGVIYPLAAVAGWRSGEPSTDRLATDSLSRQLVVRLVLAAVDLGLAWAALSASIALLPRIGLATAPRDVLDLARYALFLWPAMTWREGLYPGYGLTEPDELRRQVWGATSAGIIFLAGTVFFGANLGIEPTTVVATTVLTILLLPVGRATAKRILRALGLWGRPVVIVGSGKTAMNIARTLTYRSLDGLRPVALFGDRELAPASSAKDATPVPYLGPISAANTFARREGIHHAIVAMDPNSVPLHLPKVDPAEDAFTLVQYVPDLPGLPVLGVRAGSLDNLLALEVRNELASPVNRVAKRGIDITATVVGGLLISPILLGLAAAVALDSRGPVFFGHTRIGRNGRPIKVWKFRTMAQDAPEALERHLAADPALRAEWEATHKLKNDPRVTRVGRTLRRYSLDELPQLWNVLKGEMSLVGPRPIVDAEVSKYRDAFDLYTMVRPGMTGYWQISGRSDTDYDQRVELDGFYVRNWSVWLDIVVLIKTVSAVLKRDGAY